MGVSACNRSSCNSLFKEELSRVPEESDSPATRLSTSPSSQAFRQSTGVGLSTIAAPTNPSSRYSIAGSSSSVPSPAPFLGALADYSTQCPVAAPAHVPVPRVLLPSRPVPAPPLSCPRLTLSCFRLSCR
ncbi:hypothetical protein EYF80_037669 [Liparis tanakae]|uniref:Uncharacterized protein n=1 Tax=Liparis tanakae TaxID=230148 RepID=A0A4Z2GFR9_9TELE|nr:hypothetical protein EYF80_037669 [Liparis tanakae]